MKTSSENEDEISFNQNIVFDEATNSKFGKFEKITEKEFENAVSLENIEMNNNEQKDNKENEQKSDLEQTSNNKQAEFSSFKKTKSMSKKIEFSFGKSSNPFDEFGKKISNEYNDPYDFFFSQKYLVPFFIFAVICQVLFGL